MTRGEIVTDIMARMQDPAGAIWSADEVVIHVVNAYQQIAMTLRVFFDWVYLENIPSSFSYTAPWEAEYLGELNLVFNAGVANFTAEVDRRALSDGRDRLGPANHTSPFEATDGWLADVHADTSISATADVPETLTIMDRVTWDNRGIDGLSPRQIQDVDNRYELTKGEVYGFLWQNDGIRTVRKVRVPAAMANVPMVTGSWGVLRSPADLTVDRITGTWGLPRQIPGQHPIGSELFGAPRRPYVEGNNVRVEHFRQGRALEQDTDVCELPDVYARYLRDYAQAKLFGRAGPGQDPALAEHFRLRWVRNLGRIAARVERVDTERVAVLGGDGRSLTTRPPRPSRPWAYGSVVR